MLLAINGKFPVCSHVSYLLLILQTSCLLNEFFQGDYVDGRFSDPPSGLEANLGRMPILSVGA